jgi:hypothetical protein
LPYNTAAGVNYIATGREYDLNNLGLYPENKGEVLASIFIKAGVKFTFRK